MIIFNSQLFQRIRDEKKISDIHQSHDFIQRHIFSEI